MFDKTLNIKTSRDQDLGRCLQSPFTGHLASSCGFRHGGCGHRRDGKHRLRGYSVVGHVGPSLDAFLLVTRISRHRRLWESESPGGQGDDDLFQFLELKRKEVASLTCLYHGNRNIVVTHWTTKMTIRNLQF